MSTFAPAPRVSLAPALVALILGAAAMGVSPIFVRLADVGPFASAFWRVFLSLPVLWLWMRVSERAATTAQRRGFSHATILAGLAFTGDLFFWHLSIVHTSVANATFFATSAPLWVVVFGWLLLGERVGLPVLAGLALCLLGGVGLIYGSLQAAAGHVLGDMFGALTGVFFGLYFLAVRASRFDDGAARVTFEVTLITALLLGLSAAVLDDRLLPRSATGWGTLLSLALVSHAGGQGLLSIALGRLPAVFSSLVIFLEAIVAALVAWIALGEPVTPLQAGGGLFIVAGIFVARPRSDVQPASK